MKTPKLTGDVAVYTLVTAARSAISLVAVPIYIAYLEPTDFGLVEAAAVVAALFTKLIFQVNVSYARLYYEHDGLSRKRLQLSLTVIFLVAGLVTALLGFVGSSFFSSWFSGAEDADTVFVVTLLSVLPTGLFEAGILQCRLEGRVKVFTFLFLSEAILKACIALFFVISLGMGAVGYVLGMLVGAIIGVLMAMAAKALKFGVASKAQINELLEYTYPMEPGVLATYINQFAGKYFIAFSFSLTVLATYALASKITVIAKFAIQGFRMAWQPLAMKEIAHQSSLDFVMRHIIHYSILAAIAILTIGIGIASTGHLLIPSEYSGDVINSLVPILLCATLVLGMSDMFSAQAHKYRKQGSISVAIISGVLVNLSVLSLFATGSGIQLAAYAFLLSSVSIICVFTVLWWRRDGALRIFGVAVTALLLQLISMAGTLLIIDFF